MDTLKPIGEWKELLKFHYSEKVQEVQRSIHPDQGNSIIAFVRRTEVTRNSNVLADVCRIIKELTGGFVKDFTDRVLIQGDEQLRWKEHFTTMPNLIRLELFIEDFNHKLLENQ